MSSHKSATPRNCPAQAVMLCAAVHLQASKNDKFVFKQILLSVFQFFSPVSVWVRPFCQST
jgi:hypothetical protein